MANVEFVDADGFRDDVETAATRRAPSRWTATLPRSQQELILRMLDAALGPQTEVRE